MARGRSPTESLAERYSGLWPTHGRREVLSRYTHIATAVVRGGVWQSYQILRTILEFELIFMFDRTKYVFHGDDVSRIGTFSIVLLFPVWERFKG